MHDASTTSGRDLWAMLGAALLMIAAYVVPVAALAAVFWLVADWGAASVVLLLGAVLPAVAIVVGVIRAIRILWIYRITRIELDDHAGQLRLSGFRERVDGRITRIAQREIPCGAIRSIRRTTHGADWETTIEWVDPAGTVRQSLLDFERTPQGPLSALLSERLGLPIEQRND